VSVLVSVNMAGAMKQTRQLLFVFDDNADRWRNISKVLSSPDSQAKRLCNVHVSRDRFPMSIHLRQNVPLTLPTLGNLNITGQYHTQFNEFMHIIYMKYGLLNIDNATLKLNILASA